jgi:hypothetical protein
MKIKTSKDLAPSVRGSSFRKVTCDLRSRYLTEIATLRRLQREGRRLH